MPEWSPVRTFGGYGAWADFNGAGKQALQRKLAMSCGCANACNIHGHARQCVVNPAAGQRSEILLGRAWLRVLGRVMTTRCRALTWPVRYQARSTDLLVSEQRVSIHTRAESIMTTQLVRTAPAGALLLRLISVFYWAIHWWYKVGFRGMAATVLFFNSLGLLAWLTWFDISYEVLIAILLLLGFSFVSPASAAYRSSSRR
jgi:hypothetical protein